MIVVRPAFVLTDRPIGPGASLIWTAMITNAARPDWPDDIPIDEWERLGLIVPSKIRTAKLTTNEVASASLISRAPERLIAHVLKKIISHLN